MYGEPNRFALIALPYCSKSKLDYTVIQKKWPVLASESRYTLLDYTRLHPILLHTVLRIPDASALHPSRPRPNDIELPDMPIRVVLP